MRPVLTGPVATFVAAFVGGFAFCPALGAMTGMGSSASALDTSGAVKLRLCAPAWRYIGEQKPQDVAKDFTVVFGRMPPADFHQGNPGCKCLAYTLGPYVAKALLTKLPAEALAHGSTGEVVKARAWANWLVCPDNPKWIEYITETNRKAMESDFDGLFVDSMGTAPVESNYVLSPAINPKTGKPYTKSEWLAAECVMLDAIRKALPKGKLLTLNGLGPGKRYWTEPENESPRVLLKYVDGAMSESIWRAAPAKLADWPSPEGWMGDVKMIQDVERRGLMGFWWTKCWTDGNTSNNEPNAKVLVPQWRRFALASYLLAAGPRSYFNFDTMKNDKPKSNAAERFPEYEAPLGTATGPMEEVQGKGVYRRPFSNGFVIVNPGDKAVEGIDLPATKGAPLYSWGEDRTVASPLTVAAHTGLILTPR